MERDEILPIFIGYTRSFWLGIVPIIITTAEFLATVFSDAATAGPVAGLMSMILAPHFAITAEQINTVMQGLLPFYGLFIAQQRAGYARPYTLDPRAK